MLRKHNSQLYYKYKERYLKIRYKLFDIYVNTNPVVSKPIIIGKLTDGKIYIPFQILEEVYIKLPGGLYTRFNPEYKKQYALNRIFKMENNLFDRIFNIF